MKTKITEEIESQILTLYDSGIGVKEISKIIGIKWIQPITNTLRRNNKGDFRSSNRKEMNSEENIRKILKLREEGLSTFRIAEKLGFYPQFITNVLKRQSSFYKKRTVFSRIYKMNEDYFSIIDTPEKAYIIGFICADGYVCKTGVQFCLSSQDTEILEKIREEMSLEIPIYFTEQENPYKKGKKICHLCNLRIHSVKMRKDISFIPNNKTYNLDSSVIDFIPKEFIRDFLRGYFDGDGGVYYNKYGKHTYSVVVAGNKEFLEGTFQKYFPSTNKMSYDKKSRQMWIWRITSKDKVKSFLEYLYKDSTIFLDRKYNVFELSQCAHIKPIELLETPLETRAISSEA